MLYPKRFEKTAIDAGVVLDAAFMPAVSLARKVNKAIGIVNREPAEQPEPVPEAVAAEAAANAEGAAPLYAKHEGMIYPAVFGYEVPAQYVPRIIRPVLRNLPDGEVL